jgi:hypothetical protein
VRRTGILGKFSRDYVGLISGFRDGTARRSFSGAVIYITVLYAAELPTLRINSGSD